MVTVLAASFGPSLAFACISLGYILLSRRNSVITKLAMISNTIAGAMVTAMLIVQLAIRYSDTNYADEQLQKFIITRIWDVDLGLDVAFDVFIGLGTLFFGISMLKDSRFGKLAGALGIIIGAVVILGFNFYTFPVPPKDAGLFDPGPFAGLWYLAVTVLIIRYYFRRKKLHEPL